MGPCPSKQSHQGSPAKEGGWQIHFIKKSSRGEKYKIPKFQKPDYFHTLCSLTREGPKIRVFQGKFSKIQALQIYANTFLISSPLLAINGKQYAWISSPISTPTQLLLFVATEPLAET